MYRFAFISLFLLLCLSSFSQSRKYSNEFLNIGVGSRAFGMAGTVVASVNDVTAGYWNPAGLVHMTGDIQLGLMHSEYFAGIAKYDYAALAAPIDNLSVVGFSVIRFAVDDIPDTSELIDADGNINYDRVKSFSAADYAFLLSYARKTKNERLSLGGNAKVIHRKVGDFGKAWGFGVDAGAQYRMNKWTYALMFRDITSTFNAWSYTLNDQVKETFTQTGNEIPKNSLELTLPRLITGIQYETRLAKGFGLATELDAEFTTDGPRNVFIHSNSGAISLDPRIGCELDYKKMVMFRAGLGNIQRSTDFNGKEMITVQPNLGLGIRIKNLHLDYALTDVGNVSDALYSNVFSLRLDIHKQARE